MSPARRETISAHAIPQRRDRAIVVAYACSIIAHLLFAAYLWAAPHAASEPATIAVVLVTQAAHAQPSADGMAGHTERTHASLPATPQPSPLPPDHADHRGIVVGSTAYSTQAASSPHGLASNADAQITSHSDLARATTDSATSLALRSSSARSNTTHAAIARAIRSRWRTPIFTVLT